MVLLLRKVCEFGISSVQLGDQSVSGLELLGQFIFGFFEGAQVICKLGLPLLQRLERRFHLLQAFYKLLLLLLVLFRAFLNGKSDFLGHSVLVCSFSFGEKPLLGFQLLIKVPDLLF